MAKVDDTKYVLRIDDATVFKLFGEINNILSDFDIKIQYFISGSLEIKSNDTQFFEDMEGRYSFQRVQLFLALPDSAQIKNINMNVNFRRQSKVDENPLYDIITITINPDIVQWEKYKKEIFRIYNKIAKYGLNSESVEEKFTPQLSEIIRNLGLAQQRYADDARKLQIKYEERRQELQQEADDEKQKWRDEYEQKISKLEEEREKLNLQSHKAERRRHFERIFGEATKNARKAIVSQGAIRTRWAVAVATFLGGIAAAIFSFQKLEGFSVEQTSAVDWVALGTGSVSAVISLAFFAYTANWLKSFYMKDFAFAQEQQRFLYDLNRASWVIEAILEMEKEYGAEIPQEWVEGVTKGLFDFRIGNSDSTEADIIAALLGVSGSLSFGPDGTRIEMGKRDARRAARIIREAETADAD